MSAAGNRVAVIGQAAEMARADGTETDDLGAVLHWLATARANGPLDPTPLAVIGEIVTLLFAADAKKS